MVQHSGLHSHGHCSSLPHARLCNTGDSGEKALRPVPPGVAWQAIGRWPCCCAPYLHENHFHHLFLPIIVISSFPRRTGWLHFILEWQRSYAFLCPLPFQPYLLRDSFPPSNGCVHDRQCNVHSASLCEDPNLKCFSAFGLPVLV